MLFLFVWAGHPAWGQVGAAPESDPRFQRDQRLEADTLLGPVTIGISGLSENARQRSTVGDVELGYRYEIEFDSVFPRIAELRPFLFNRGETTETTYYETLGVGGGVRLSLRDKYELNNWFVRLSVLTPNASYRERYNLDRNQTSITEMVLGYELPIGVDSIGRDMRRRVTLPATVRLRVPAVLFDPANTIDPAVLERVHEQIIGAYLAIISRQDSRRPLQRRMPDPKWRVLRLIENETDLRITQKQWYVLTDGRSIDAQERTTQRREIVADFIRRGLTRIMRGPHPLLFEAIPESGPDPLLQPQTSTPVAIMSIPGISLKPKNKPLDADTMIEHYIAAVIERIE